MRTSLLFGLSHVVSKSLGCVPPHINLCCPEKQLYSCYFAGLNKINAIESTAIVKSFTTLDHSKVNSSAQTVNANPLEQTSKHNADTVNSHFVTTLYRKHIKIVKRRSSDTMVSWLHVGFFASVDPFTVNIDRFAQMCDLRGKLLSTNGTQNKSFLCEVVHFGYHSLVMITKWACKHCINLRGDLFWWGFTGLPFSL